MKIKLFVKKQLEDVQMVFGSGVSTFLDRAKKILYLVPSLQYRSVQFKQYQIGIMKFVVDPQTWREFKRVQIEKGSMVLSHNEYGYVYCYKFKILMAISIKTAAIMLVVMEKIDQTHNSEYLDTYFNRYYLLKNQKTHESYFLIDYFKK